MYIRLYWKDCEYHKSCWGLKKQDSYWLECTEIEAQEKIYPLLNQDVVEKSLQLLESNDGNELYNIIPRYTFFLVSKDISTIMPMPWFYPYSGQWGAFCPFISIETIQIADIYQIRLITPKIIANEME
jgi:hypothetical protein